MAGVRLGGPLPRGVLAAAALASLVSSFASADDLARVDPVTGQPLGPGDLGVGADPDCPRVVRAGGSARFGRVDFTWSEDSLVSIGSSRQNDRTSGEGRPAGACTA